MEKSIGILQQNTSFGLKLLKQLKSEKNLIFSPFNILESIAMIYLGSQSNTQKQIQQALNLKDDQQIHEYIQQFKEETSESNKNSKNTLKYGVKILLQDSYEINQKYKKELKQFYNSKLELVNFEKDSKQIITKTNQWVENLTEGLIKIALSTLEQNLKMVLINAIYFKGLWNIPFKEDKTKKMNFKGLKTTQQLKMMHTENNFKKVKMDDFEALQMDYKEGEYSFVVVLPDENIEFSTFISDFSQETLTDLETKFCLLERRSKVSVYIPKFKIEKLINLEEILQKMGITDAFSDVKADFSNISKQKDIYVSEMKHRAVIEVDEKGSKAAAVTVTKKSRMRKVDVKNVNEFKADRSFMFYIRENLYGNLLFMGVFQGN